MLDDERATLRVGGLAYYDSLRGLVPCKVESITGTDGRPSTAQRVVLVVTTDHSPYKKGERIETNGIHAVPKWCGNRGEYGQSIWAYTVEVQS